MCFHYALSEKAKTLENRFKAQIKNNSQFKSFEHSNGFNHPENPVITNDKKSEIQFFKWV